MFPRTIDIYRVLPELVWCGSGALVMLMQPFVRSKHFFTFLALIGTLAGTAASVTAAMHAGPGFGGLVQSDSFSFFFRLLVGTVAFLAVLAAGPYLGRERQKRYRAYEQPEEEAEGIGLHQPAESRPCMHCRGDGCRRPCQRSNQREKREEVLAAHKRLHQHHQSAGAAPHQFWEHTINVDGAGKHLTDAQPF